MWRQRHNLSKSPEVGDAVSAGEMGRGPCVGGWGRVTEGMTRWPSPVWFQGQEDLDELPQVAFQGC